jgi:hypothetical protein
VPRADPREPARDAAGAGWFTGTRIVSILTIVAALVVASLLVLDASARLDDPPAEGSPPVTAPL